MAIRPTTASSDSSDERGDVKIQTRSPNPAATAAAATIDHANALGGSRTTREDSPRSAHGPYVAARALSSALMGLQPHVEEPTLSVRSPDGEVPEISFVIPCLNEEDADRGGRAATHSTRSPSLGVSGEVIVVDNALRGPLGGARARGRRDRRARASARLRQRVPRRPPGRARPVHRDDRRRPHVRPLGAARDGRAAARRSRRRARHAVQGRDPPGRDAVDEPLHRQPDPDAGCST